MKTPQNSPINRDQEKRTLAQATGTADANRAAEKVAAANRRLEDEDTGPMTPPELFDKKSRNPRTSPSSDTAQANRSPKQENL